MDDKVCQFCKKIFSNKANSKKHLNICKVKKQFDTVESQNKTKNLNEEIQKLKQIIIQKDEQINLLKTIIENQKPTIINNNNNNYRNTNNTINYVSNLEPINFEEMKEQFEKNLSNKYIDKGVEGIAMFICDIPCENKFITSDYSRKLVSYKNPQQQTIIDPKGNILLNNRYISS